MKTSSPRHFIKLILILSFFLLCLILGFRGGVLYNRLKGENTPYSTITAAPTLPHPLTEQENILLILIDDITKSQPTLLGTWLLIKTETPPKLIFLPIYPSTDNINTKLDENLNQSFSLNKSNFPNQQYWNELIAHKYWWNNYILLDREALSTIIDSIGGITYEKKRLSGNDLLSLITAKSDKSEFSMDGQYFITKAICNQMQKHEEKNPVDSIFKQSSKGIITDFNPNELTKRWNNIIQGQSQFSCEFPSFP